MMTPKSDTLIRLKSFMYFTWSPMDAAPNTAEIPTISRAKNRIE